MHVCGGVGYTCTNAPAPAQGAGSHSGDDSPIMLHRDDVTVGSHEYESLAAASSVDAGGGSGGGGAGTSG